MLIRLDNPRLVINAQEFPEHVVIMALQFEDATGAMTVNYLEGSQRVTQYVQPTRVLNILDGMVLHEFVLPFTELHDHLGRRGATGGFHFVGNSAFRAQAANYGTRTLDFMMQFPVTGGGIIRFSIGGQEWDLSNPTFNPRSVVPPINPNYGAGAADDYQSGPSGISNQRVPDNVLINAYQRTHRGLTNRDQAIEINRRRAERIANFDLREEGLPTEADPPPDEGTLEGGTYREPARRVILDPVEERRQDRLAQAQQSEQRQQGERPQIVMAPTRTPKAPPRTRFERDD